MGVNRFHTYSAAGYIKRKLLEQGVVLQVYESYTTKSVYIKIDCGISNTIRISDHKGKNHLNYFININTSKKGPVDVDINDYTQYTYSATENHLKKAVAHILSHRQKKIDRLGGYQNYRKQMVREYYRNKNRKGFWSQAEFLSLKTMS